MANLKLTYKAIARLRPTPCFDEPLKLLDALLVYQTAFETICGEICLTRLPRQNSVQT